MSWPPDQRFAGIRVVGHGVVRATPDLATFRIAAVASAPTATQATEQASAAMRAMLAEIDAAGIARSDRQTHGIHVTSWREYEGQPVRYQASQHLVLHVRDVPSAGETIGRVLSAGGDCARVEQSTLSLADEAAHQDQAREAAMADATRKARQLARLAGRSLGAVVAVSEAPGAVPMVAQSRDLAAPAAFTVPVESGEVEIAVTLAVEFAWGD
jgi:hypothetical protein